MRSLLFAFAFIAAQAHAQTQDALGYKGVPLGADRAELLARFPALECRAPNPKWSDADEVCNPMLCPGEACITAWNSLHSYGGERVEGVKFDIIAGKVEGFAIQFPWTSWGRVRDAAKAAYGDGFEEVQQMQGARGVPFPSRIWGVEKPNGTMAIFERAGGGSGALFCSSPASKERSRMRTDANRGKDT